MTVVLDQVRMAQYDIYVHAHRNFHQERILKQYLARDQLGSVVDFDGIEYLSYEEIIQNLKVNPQKVQEAIREKINEAQSLFDQVFSIKYKQSDSQQELTKKFVSQINDLLQAAKIIIELYHKCERTKRDGYVEQVYSIVQNIKDQIKIIKSSKHWKTSGIFGVGRIREGQIKYETIEFLSVANFLYDGMGKPLGHMFESLLSSRIGYMPYEIQNQVQKTVKKFKKKTLRGKGMVKSSVAFTGPEAQYDIFPSTLESSGGTGVVDYWIKGDLLGLDINLPVSQKEYRQSSWRGNTIEIPGIESNIGEIVTSVASNAQQVYALYGAFSNPSSRGTKPSRGGSLGSSLAEAILRDTIAESMVGFGDDLAKGLMLNRKLYTFASIFTKLFKGTDLNKTDIVRVSVEGATDRKGTEQASEGTNAAERYKERSRSEKIAAGIYMSKKRLESIRNSSFSTKWNFDRSWFEKI